MGRKNLLSDLMDSLPEAESAPSTDTLKSNPTLGARGAVGAMSRSLEKLSAETNAARSLHERVASGQMVVEIDPSMIDASFVPDRMPGNHADHAGLVRSISETGQLVPVLLRPHPQIPSRFQTAYGHRRVRALTELGKPVRAIVRQMTDDELVVAQGKENGERQDLSFIERALYALTLEDRGFRRETIGSALSVDKTELSRLVSVGRTVPRDLIDAIGPAPKVGRRRWMELEQLLQGRETTSDLRGLVTSDKFASSDSDTRFVLVCAALAPPSTKLPSTPWTAEDGRKIASIDRNENRTVVATNEKLAPGFGDFIVQRLGQLYAEFLEGQAKS
jgi:ParB family chromosome partitioning protein